MDCNFMSNFIDWVMTVFDTTCSWLPVVKVTDSGMPVVDSGLELT